jgi:hypothetical protein
MLGRMIGQVKNRYRGRWIGTSAVPQIADDFGAPCKSAEVGQEQTAPFAPTGMWGTLIDELPKGCAETTGRSGSKCVGWPAFTFRHDSISAAHVSSFAARIDLPVCHSFPSAVAAVAHA